MPTTQTKAFITKINRNYTCLAAFSNISLTKTVSTALTRRLHFWRSNNIFDTRAGCLPGIARLRAQTARLQCYTLFSSTIVIILQMLQTYYTKQIGFQDTDAHCVHLAQIDTNRWSCAGLKRLQMYIDDLRNSVDISST